MEACIYVHWHGVLITISAAFCMRRARCGRFADLLPQLGFVLCWLSRSCVRFAKGRYIVWDVVWERRSVAEDQVTRDEAAEETELVLVAALRQSMTINESIFQQRFFEVSFFGKYFFFRQYTTLSPTHGHTSSSSNAEIQVCEGC